MENRILEPVYKNEFLTVIIPAVAARAAIVAEKAEKDLLIISGDPIYAKLETTGAKCGTLIYSPCPCGFYGSSRVKCTCSVDAIEAATISSSQIFNAVRLDAVDLFSFRMFSFSNKVHDSAVMLAKQAFAEGYIKTAADMINTVEIAAAIAALDGIIDRIDPEHIAEAISYRNK